MQHTAIFHGCKNDNFRLQSFDYFHIFAQNIDWGYMLEAPPEALLTCTHNLCFEQKYENSQKNSTENCHIFTAVKNRCMLHGHVFVMRSLFSRCPIHLFFCQVIKPSTYIKELVSQPGRT